MEKFATISVPCHSNPNSLGCKTHRAPAWTKIVPKLSHQSSSRSDKPLHNGNHHQSPAAALQLATEGADSTTPFANFRIRRSGAYLKHKKMKKKFFVLLEHCDPPFDQSRLEYYDIPVKRWLSIVNRLSGTPRSDRHSTSHPELLRTVGETFCLETGPGSLVQRTPPAHPAPPKHDSGWYVSNAKPKRRVYLKDCFNIDRLRPHASSIPHPDPKDQSVNKGGGSVASFIPKKSSLTSHIHPRSLQLPPDGQRSCRAGPSRYAVSTQAQDPFNCVTFSLDTSEEMEAWLEDLWILHQLSTKGLLTFPLAPNYEWVWEVSLRTQGINAEYRLYGSYYVCLNPDDSIFTFYKYCNYYDTDHYYQSEEEEDYYFHQTLQNASAATAQSSLSNPYDRPPDPGSGSASAVPPRPRPSQSRKDVQIAYIELCSIKRCGHANNFFYAELGRTSSLGPGEIWMHLVDNGQAQQLHSLILDRMKCKGKMVSSLLHPNPTNSGSNNNALGTGELSGVSESGATPVNTAIPARKRIPPLVLSPVGAGVVTARATPPNNPDNSTSSNYSSSSSGTLTYLPLPHTVPTVEARRTFKTYPPKYPAPSTSYVEMHSTQTASSPPDPPTIGDAEWPMTFLKQADTITFGTPKDSTKDAPANLKDPPDYAHDVTAYAPMTISSHDLPNPEPNFLLQYAPKTSPDPHHALPVLAMVGADSNSSDRSRLGSDASAISSTYSYTDSNPLSDHWLVSSSPEARTKRSGLPKDRDATALCKMSLGDRLQYLKEQCRGGTSDRQQDGALGIDNLQANNTEAIFASHDSGYMDMVPSGQQPLPQNSATQAMNPTQKLAQPDNLVDRDQIYASNPRISSPSTDPEVSYHDGVALQISTPSIASLGSSLSSTPFPFSAPAKSCFLADNLDDSQPDLGDLRLKRWQSPADQPHTTDSVQELSAKIEKVPGLYFSALGDDRVTTIGDTPFTRHLVPPAFSRTASFYCSNSTGLLSSKQAPAIVSARVTTSFDVLVDRTIITPRPRRTSKGPPSPPPFPDFFFKSKARAASRCVEGEALPPLSPTHQPSPSEDEYQSLADRVRAYSLGSRPSPPFISLRSRKKNIKSDQQSGKMGHHSATKSPLSAAMSKKHHPIPPRFPIIEGLVFDSLKSPTTSREIGFGGGCGTILHNVMIEEAPHESATP